MEANKRLQITMNPDLLIRVDEYAENSGVSRSAAISILCSDMLQQKSFLAQFPQLMAAYQEDPQLMAAYQEEKRVQEEKRKEEK